MIKKILKFLIWLSIIVWFSWLLAKQDFFNVAEAQSQAPVVQNVQWDTEDYIEKNMYKMRDMLDVVTKAIYLITRPLLVIAWNSLDNSLIYWSIFHLDAPLRSFWNIMKNFANFALWFLLLYSIIRSLLKKWWASWAIWIVKNTLIAWILIQASWFLLQAVIDVSTIATYAVWWIPMTILKNSPQWNNPILWISSSINLSDSSSSLKDNLEDSLFYRTYWKNKEFKISSCKTYYADQLKKTYILWKQHMFASDSSWDNVLLQTWYCILAWAPYKINEFPELETAINNSDYKTEQNTLIKTPKRSEREKCWLIIPTFETSTYDPNTCTIAWINFASTWELGAVWWKIRLEWLTNQLWQDWITTLANLIEKSKWFVWPLITIYSSILNFSSIADDPWSSSDDMTFGVVLKFAIKTFIWIMLILPLFALAIVLLARIWILRLVIAFMPIIILLHFFKDEIKLDMKNMSFLNVSEIFKIIFAPVFVVFGLSLALIFLSTISNLLNQKDSQLQIDWEATKQQTLEWMWISQDWENSYSVLWWLSSFKIEWNLFWWVLDDLSYLLINIFWIAVMRMLLFRAIKQNSIWKNIWTKIQKFGENLAVNVPIVPIGQWVWLKQAFGVWWWEWILWKWMDQITNTMERKNTQNLIDRWFLPPETSDEKAQKEKDKEQNAPADISQEQAKKIIAQIETNNLTRGATNRETTINDILKNQWVTTDKNIKDRIQTPANAVLLLQAIEWLENKEQKAEVSWAIGDRLENSKSVTDYKESRKNKKIESIIKDLDDHKVEALISISPNQEIILKDNKKYKITKNPDWTYKSEEITTPPAT